MTALQALVLAVIAGGLFVASIAGLAGLWWAMLAAAILLGAAVALLYDPATGRSARDPR